LHLLQIRNLSGAGFGPVNLSLTDGACLCLSGPSGAGKSRLLRAIADLDPHRGELMLDRRPSGEFSPSEWRRRVGLLPAESGWWSDRVGDHFDDGISPETVNDLGFDTDIFDEPVDHLSSGQKQRLALLRLLANQPEVLLLDEPTANLDPANTGRVEMLLAHTMRGGAALLWVSHDPAQIARVSNRHQVMGNGVLLPTTEGQMA
jgi:ABC-type iron transport system FetAB ATPase subunit